MTYAVNQGPFDSGFEPRPRRFTARHYGNDSGSWPALIARVRAARRRRWLRRLMAFDEHILADIGYQRADLTWAMRLPAAVNPVQALGRRGH